MGGEMEIEATRSQSEKFPHSAVGFRSKDQAASRARIFSWSGAWKALLPQVVGWDWVKISRLY